MTTFKDLLSQDDWTTIKTTSNYWSQHHHEDNQHKKADDIRLAKQTDIVKQVKQLNSSHINDDKFLFMQAMTGVRPLKQSNRIQHQTKKSNDANASLRRASAVGTQKQDNLPISDMQALLNPVASEAYLSYKNPTLQNKIFEQLRLGKMHWHMTADLHACSIDDARNAIIDLINNAQNEGETVVKIIHGKGDAIIKTCVNGWLRQIDDVMAFCSAPSKDGGNGSVLLLLKRKKNIR